MWELIQTGVRAAGKLIGGEVGEKIEGAMDALRGRAAVDPELQKLIAHQELELRKIALADAEGIRRLLTLEVQSEDKFVRRVRPALCWVVVAVIATYFCIIPTIQTIVVALGYTAIEVAVPDIPASTASMMISLVGFYMGARSWDKRNRLKNGK